MRVLKGYGEYWPVNSRYTKGTYEQFAKMVSGLKSHISEPDRLKVASEIERIFREDNNAFASARFMKACNVETSK